MKNDSYIILVSIHHFTYPLSEAEFLFEIQANAMTSTFYNLHKSVMKASV